MMKRITVIIAALMMAAVFLAACGGESDAMKIGPYEAEGEPEQLVALAGAGVNESAIFRFNAGTAVNDMVIGYEEYENGSMIDDVDQCGNSRGDGAMSGFLGLWFSDDGARISTAFGDSASAVTGEVPWSGYENKEGYSSGSASAGMSDIEKGEKIYIYGHYIGKTDGGLEISAPEEVMSDEELLAGYDKAYIYYVIFK